jgi:hypothetical protein
MKTPRKGTSDSGAESAKARDRRQTEGARHGNKKEIPNIANQRRSDSKISDLPPNKNIRKYPDEIYGDTEIPERKEDI